MSIFLSSTPKSDNRLPFFAKALAGHELKRRLLPRKKFNQRSTRPRASLERGRWSIFIIYVVEEVSVHHRVIVDIGPNNLLKTP